MKNLLHRLLLPNKRRFPILIVATGFLFAVTPVALTQEEALPVPPSSAPISAPSQGLYFADVLVRGRSIYEASPTCLGAR